MGDNLERHGGKYIENEAKNTHDEVQKKGKVIIAGNMLQGLIEFRWSNDTNAEYMFEQDCDISVGRDRSYCVWLECNGG